MGAAGGAIALLTALGFVAVPSVTALRGLTLDAVRAPQLPVPFLVRGLTVATEGVALPLALSFALAILSSALVSGGVVPRAWREPRPPRPRSGDWRAPRQVLLGAAMAGVSAIFAWTHRGDLILLAGQSDAALGPSFLRVLIRFAIVAAVSLLAFGALDVLAARALWRRGHRMTRAEVARERRAEEGDPLARGARRRAHRALVDKVLAHSLDDARVAVLGRSVLAVVSSGDPTLRWVERGPRVGAALRVLEAAKVPVVMDEKLAQGLVPLPIGTRVPRRLYPRLARTISPPSQTDRPR